MRGSGVRIGVSGVIASEGATVPADRLGSESETAATAGKDAPRADGGRHDARHGDSGSAGKVSVDSASALPPAARSKGSLAHAGSASVDRIGTRASTDVSGALPRSGVAPDAANATLGGGSPPDTAGRDVNEPGAPPTSKQVSSTWFSGGRGADHAQSEPATRPPAIPGDDASPSSARHEVHRRSTDGAKRSSRRGDRISGIEQPRVAGSSRGGPRELAPVDDGLRPTRTADDARAASSSAPLRSVMELPASGGRVAPPPSPGVAPMPPMMAESVVATDPLDNLDNIIRGSAGSQTAKAREVFGSIQVPDVETGWRATRAASTHQLVLRLSADEKGNPALDGVRVVLRVRGAQVHARFVSESADMAARLRESLPELRQLLARQGLDPSTVDVVSRVDPEARGRHPRQGHPHDRPERRPAKSDGANFEEIHRTLIGEHPAGRPSWPSMN